MTTCFSMPLFSRQGAKLTFLAVAIVGMPILETLLLALAQSPSFARMTSTSANAVLNGPFTLIGGLVRRETLGAHFMDLL